MAALRTLIQGDLPPTGNPIKVYGASSQPPGFPGYRAVWLQSGTAALALALIAAREKAPAVTRPEVIIPAYGCPDLVAAAVYAGLQPVLVDINADFHGYDLDKISAAICSSTVAIIAVNFLGIPERLASIQAIASAWPQISLVEDNAQWYPENTGLKGDFVCLSFGRGKPVSLLGGGCLLIREPAQFATLTETISNADSHSRLLLQMKYHAYNQLLKPWIYQFLSRNPWLKLGETHYKPLSGLQAMDKQRLALLSRNINDYLNRKPWQEKAIASIIAESKLQLLDLPNAAGNSGRLLRYPILCESAAKRDRLHNILSAAGLGASTMYQRPLTAINGVAERASWDGALQGAESFSQRLLTLPTHQGVIKADLQSLAQILG